MAFHFALTAVLLLGFLADVATAVMAPSFQPLSRLQIDHLPLEAKLQLLEERGVICDDCSEQDVAEEVFTWQQLPVRMKKSRGVQDEANVNEALRQMRKSGFGPPSSLAKSGLGSAHLGQEPFVPPAVKKAAAAAHEKEKIKRRQ